jgi:carboxylate-amine ligase
VIPTAGELRAAFDEPARLSIGLEEEVMLLDAETFDLAPRAAELVARLHPDPRFKQELPAAQLEIATPPSASVAEAVSVLADGRRSLSRALDGSLHAAVAGVHPFAAPLGRVTKAERYEEILAEYGATARRQLVFALQVHVAVRGADRALAVYNGLRSYLPELAALAANAPFHDGRDTGLASVRPQISENLPRQGIPPAIESWEGFAEALRWGSAAGGVPEPRRWWWELRPHPEYGTLELRVPDAQSTLADTAAVAAVAHSLVAALAARHDAGEPLRIAPTWRIEENRWSALRHGLAGSMADLESGEVERTSDRLHRLVDELGEASKSVGCSGELSGAHRLIEQGGGSARQREIAAESGLPGLARRLAELFLAGA